MLKIAVDLDGVIWDIMGVFLELYNEKYNLNIQYEDVTDWYFFPHEAFETIYPETLKRIDDYQFLDEDISFYLSALMLKYEIIILTHEANTVENLKNKLEKANIREGLEYSEFIKQDRHWEKKTSVNCDIYIDDNPLMVKEIEAYPNRILLLYDQPWNWYIDCEMYDNVIRVKNWEEAFSFLKSFK